MFLPGEILGRLLFLNECLLKFPLDELLSQYISLSFLLYFEDFLHVLVAELFVIDMTIIFVKHSASRKGRLKAVLSYLQLFHVQLLPAQPPLCFS